MNSSPPPAKIFAWHFTYPRSDFVFASLPFTQAISTKYQANFRIKERDTGVEENTGGAHQ